MKKIISLFLALTLLLGIFAVPALAEEMQSTKIGVLSYLNLSEEDEKVLGASIRRPLMKVLFLHGIVTEDDGKPKDGPPTYQLFDTLDALLLALSVKEVGSIIVPSCTAKYICSSNDKLRLGEEYHPENAATGIASWVLSYLSDGYSFMLKKDNTELRDEFDAQIAAMKEDGTLQKLIDEHIIKVAEGGEPVAVDFEQFEGDPVKVGVSGDLPPMDYVAADGSFAGFNTAVLAEIGRRLQKNIELVQVENVGRSLALSEGTVDVVFWTRAMSEDLTESRANGVRLRDFLADDQGLTEGEKAIFEVFEIPDRETINKLEARDMPDDTIITRPYFTDFAIRVVLK